MEISLLQMIRTSAPRTNRLPVDPLSHHQSIKMHRKVRKCKSLISLVILLSSGLLCRADSSHQANYQASQPNSQPAIRYNSNQNSNEINKLNEDRLSNLTSKIPKSDLINSEQNSQPNTLQNTLTSQTPNYYFEVKENTAANQLIGTVQLPAGPLYRFGNSQSAPEFRLDTTGHIYTTSHRLDRERQPFYNLIILSSQPSTANPIQVKIRILDQNDNRPFWLNESPTRQIVFSETAPVGSKVLLDSAVDLDEDELRYELLYCSPLERCACEANDVNSVNSHVNGDVNNVNRTNVNSKRQSKPFKLNFNQKSSILNLELSERLDRELQSSYMCKLCVFDLQNQSNALTLNITVFKHHAQHAPPVFKQSDYSTTLNQNLKKGDLILSVQAHEPNSKLIYRLQEAAEEDFYIEPTTGSIHIAHDGLPTCPPDTTDGQRRCVLTVLGEDTDRRQAKAQVTVHLSSSLQLSADHLHVPEIKVLYFNHRFVQYAIVDQAANFGTAVAAISVFDADSAGQTRLEIVSGNELAHFYLDAEFASAGSYVIRVNENFTNSAVKKPAAYNLTLKATDNDQLSSTQNLLIKINEMVGDHKLPVFKQQIYKVELVETAPVGSFICLVNAIDHDQQSIVYFYSLSGNSSDYFYIDSQTGMVTLAKQLDRELANEIELKVFVRDTQLDSEWSSAKIRLTIRRVNLHSPSVARRPSFKPNYEIVEGDQSTLLQIAEGNRVHYEFELIDEDLGENGSALVELLYDYQGLFFLNTTGYLNKRERVVHLHSAKELDYESAQSYELPMMLSDQGAPRRTSLHLIRIELLDLDDQPAFVYPKHYFVALNRSAPSVLQIRTVDKDKTSPIKYFFNFNHNHKNLNFVNSLASIDEHSGSIALKQFINLDAFPRYLPFNVTCDSCDRSGQQAIIHLYLNEHLKSEPKPDDEQLTISELAEPNTVLLNITSLFESLKLEDHNLVIADGDPEQNFALLNRQLVLIRRLDYEKTREYNLTICAFNDEQFRTANLIIFLRNENDLHPQFDRPFVYLEVPRSAPYHLAIYRLEAIDSDESDAIVDGIVGGSTGANSGDFSESNIDRSNTVYHFSGQQAHANSSLIQNGNYMFRINRNQLELNVNLNERRILKGGQLVYRYAEDFVYLVSIQAKDLRLKNDPLTGNQPPGNRRMINVFIKIKEPALNVVDLFAKSLEIPKPFYELNIEESRQINSRLLKFDLLYHQQLDGLLTFAFVNGNENPFGIFPDGTLYLKNKLDREQNEHFLLHVAVGLRSPPSNSTANQTFDQSNKRITVLIHVLDSNNSPPKFEKELYQFYVVESSPVNTSIGTVHATDRDLDLNSLVYYHLLPNKFASYIGLNSITGQLYLKSPVDYESLKAITLEIEAEDQPIYERRLKSKCKVQIQIVDANDVSPCFEIFDAETGTYPCSDKLKQQISIMENLKPNTTIHEFKARDPDTASDDLLRFTLVESEFSSSFDLNERTGRLKLIKNLDREINERIELLIKVDDGLHEAFNRFTLSLEDQNDNLPLWSPVHTSNRSTLFVSESTEPATSLLSLNATDYDSGLNGQVHFEIVNVESVKSPNFELCKQQPKPFCEREECFRIEGNQLMLANYLDYENEQEYAISLAAVDYYGLRSEILTVKLAVLNEMDASPRFKRASGEQTNEETISIFENVKVGTVILSLDAFDCDGNDDRLTYELVKCQILGTYHKRCPLELDAKTGKLTSIDSLDYEEIKRINLKIKVSDLAEHSDLKDLSIAIMNLNDNKPRIPLSTSFVVIKKQQQPVEKNEILAQLQAIDLDRERVLYRILSDSTDSQVEASVYVDEDDGFVYAKRRIEQNMELKFNVMLIDEGSLFTNELVHLVVLFTNASLDTRDLVFEVYENEPVGLLIHKFKCGTQENACKYYLNTCNKLFNIDEAGELRTESNLDRELKAAYYFDVFIVDPNSAIQVFKVKVAVLDRNDSSPKLIGYSIERIVRVKENERPKSVLFDLSGIVTDFDLATHFQFGLLNCSVLLNKTAKKVLNVYDNPFLIESNTGKIILNRELDREVEEKYELWFSISDGLFKVSDRLTVYVTDVNDQVPSFDRKSFSFNVPENTKNRTVIGKVEAKDLDLNSVIRYKIISEQDDSPFRINEKTGAISTIRPLDYERDNHLFISVCQASDGEFISSPVTLYFNLVNLNDMPPLFERDEYKFAFNDSERVGEQLFCLKATDEDNDRLTYRMHENEDREYQLFNDLLEEFYFEVNGESGCIQLLKPFNPAEKDLFQFTMIVTDGQHQDFASVQVHVLRRSPSTYRKNLSIRLSSETAKVGESIYRFNENVQLLNTTFVPFKINPFNELILIAKVGSEIQNKIDLKSQAYHFQVNYNQSVQNVTVNIIQPERQADPVKFERSMYEVSVPEDHKLSRPIVELGLTNFQAEDKLSLEIVSGNQNDQFMINKNQLLLRKSLDYEKIKKYLLKVRAIRDRENSSAIASIVVNVLNVVDERPVFLDSPYLFRWCENTIGEVGRFIAKSEYDLAQNNLKYILKSNEYDNFHLDTNTGLLSVVKEFDRESLKSPMIELKVLVIDELNADLQNEILATISIENLNDEKPRCSKTTNKISLSENVPYTKGYAFANVTATDRDNDILTYRLEKCLLTANLASSANSSSTPKTINQCSSIALNERTGEVYANEAVTFDRELEEEYSLLVSASDGEHLTKCLLKLKIVDMNDVQPKLSVQQSKSSLVQKELLKEDHLWLTIPYQYFTADLTESEQLFLFGLNAYDRDQWNTANSRISFKLLGGQQSNELSRRLKLNKDNGVLTIQNSLLDSEQQANRSFRLDVLLQDGNVKQPLESKLRIDLQLYDLGGAALKWITIFEPILSELQVSESTPVNTTIYDFRIVDPRLRNSTDRISLAIVGGDYDNRFKISRDEQSNFKLALARELDFEYASGYQIYLEAVVQDNQPAEQKTNFQILELSIKLINEDDNPPQFSRPVYNVTILEEQKANLFVTQLDAFDPDIQELTVRSPNTVTNLEDEFSSDNDFNSDKSNASPNEQFRFELLTADVPFRIDQYSGAVYTTDRIDREETGDLFELTVQVVDNGGLKSQAQLNVKIEDINDQVPRFTSLFRVNVSEDEEIGAFIVQITYIDRDRSANGTHQFSIDDNRFTIDQLGRVYLAAKMNCDSGEDEINVKVTLNDGEWNQDTTLTVYIQDVNNQKPQFQSCEKQFGAREENECVYHFVLDREMTQAIGNVSAIDLDKGLNSLIYYELTERSPLFKIDRLTGEILPLANYLQLQPKPSLTILTVKACDNGMLPKCSVAKVYLTRTNGRPTISLPIPLDLSNQTVIYQAASKLIDSEGFGYCNDAAALNVFSYQNQSLVFTGENRVKLGQQFQCQFWSLFELQKFTSLKIIVTKRNLFEPQFVTSRSQLMLNETNEIEKQTGKQVYQFKATDNDDGFNSELIFSLDLLGVQFHPNALQAYFKRFKNIRANNLSDQHFFAKSIKLLLLSNNQTKGYFNPFGVDARSGAMYLTNELDYQLITSYKYKITVRDGALFSPKSSSQTLDVHVQAITKNQSENDDKAMQPPAAHRAPVNETKPKFTKKQYEFDLLEQTDLNSIIANLNHTVDAHQSFEFQLLKPIEFGIDLDRDNNLIVSDQIDFESFSMNEIYKQTQMDNVSISAIKLKFGLLVKAKDGLVESSADYDRAELLINLIDLNEPPKFERPSMDCLLVRTNGPCAYQFVNECSAKASDLDQGDYLRYKLLNHNHLFSIDEHKGTINLISCNLSSVFLPSEQSLDVIAIDSNDLQSKLKVNIKLNWRSRVDPYQTILLEKPTDNMDGRSFDNKLLDARLVANSLFYANASVIDKDLISHWCVRSKQVPESTDRMICYRKTVDSYCCECKSNTGRAFRGMNDCSLEDLCGSADHCKNGGLCKQTGARERVCLCRRAFRGARCEQALTACNEKAGKCGVNGVCQIIKPFGGHRCNCNDEHTFGVECNAFSLGIRPHAYIRLNTSLHEVNDELSMTFASYYRMNYGHKTGAIVNTNQPKEEDHGQLMLYNQGQPNLQTGRTDFIAVELYEKYLLLRIGGSHQSKFVELKVHANKHDLLDGRYYKFTMIRNRKIAHISIYSCERMSMDNQLNCNSLLNQSSISYNQASFRFDSNPLFVGGLDYAHGGNGKLFAQKTKGQVQARSNFVGCLYKALYNGEKFNEFIAEKSFVDPICRPSLIGSEQSNVITNGISSELDGQQSTPPIESNIEPISQPTASSNGNHELTTNCGKEALYSKHNWFENKCGCTIPVQPQNNLTVGLNLNGLNALTNIVYESSMPCRNLCEVQLNKKSLIRLKLTDKWNAIMKSQTYQTKLEDFTIRFYLTSYASENMLSNLWTNGYLSIRLSSNGTIFMINEEDQLEQVIKLNGKFKLNHWNTYVIRSTGEQFINDQLNRFNTALFKNTLKTMIIGGDLTGCVSHLIVNGHLVLSGKDDHLYELQTENVNGFGCKGIFESSALSLDAISIGVILVIMFFAILLLVVSTSYILFQNSSKRKTSAQPRSTLPPISKHHHFHHANKTLTPNHSLSQMLGNSYSSSQGYYEEPLYYGSDYFQHNEKLTSTNFANQFNLSGRSQF